MAALLGKPCGFACTQFDACCSSLASFLCPPDSPSPVFLIYTLVLAGLPLLFAIPALISASSSASECDSKPVFLNILFFMLFQLFAVLFSFYLYRRFARPYNYSDPQDNDPCARAGRLFCHDPFVAVALVVVPVFFVYSIVALNTDVPSTCPSNVKGAATGWLPGIVLMYIMLSGAIIGLSLCCMSCSQTTTGTHTTYGHHYPATMRGYGNNNNNNSSNIGTNSRFALFGPVGGVLSYLFVPPQRQQPPTTMRQSTAPPMHVPPPVVPAPQYPQPRAPPAQPTMYAGGGYGAPPPPPHPPQQQQPTAPVTGYPVGHGGGGYAPSAPSASSFPATGGGQPYSSAPPPPPPQQQQPSAAAQIAGAAASGIASMAAAGLRTAAAGLERASQRPSQAQAQGQGQAPARPTYR